MCQKMLEMLFPKEQSPSFHVLFYSSQPKDILLNDCRAEKKPETIYISSNWNQRILSFFSFKKLLKMINRNHNGWWLVFHASINSSKTAVKWIMLEESFENVFMPSSQHETWSPPECNRNRNELLLFSIKNEIYTH